MRRIAARAALAAAVALFGWRSSEAAYALRAALAPPAATPAAEAPPDLTAATGVIVAAQLFGSRPPQAAQAAPAVRLLAILARPAGASYALLAFEGRGAEALGIGEALHGVEVRRIAAQFVLVARGGSTERLELDPAPQP